MIYAHAWPIEDTDFTFTELIAEALDDLDANVLPALDLTRTNFPDFTHPSGWLIATTEVAPAERSAA